MTDSRSPMKCLAVWGATIRRLLNNSVVAGIILHNAEPRKRRLGDGLSSHVTPSGSGRTCSDGYLANPIRASATTVLLERSNTN